MPETPKADLVIAVPTRGTVRTEWAAMLAGLALPINVTQVLRVIPDRSVEEARNIAVLCAREHQAKYLFFIDDDVLMPNQGLRRMIYKMENEPQWDLITGICPVKTDPPEPCVFRNDSPGPYWGWTFNEYFEVDACGMGCCLINMRAFDTVPEPWFAWDRKLDGANTKEEGEDISFCRKLKEGGGLLLADGGLLCAHMNPDGKTWMLDSDSAPFQRGAEALAKFNVISQT